MANKSEDSESKVFDVAQPEEAKLNIGSKPMVIGHKPAPDTTIAPTEETAAPSKKIKLEPLSEQEKSADDTSPVDKEDDVSKVPESISDESPKPEITEEKEESRDFAAEAENEEQTAQDIEAEREEKVEELKKSRKYHVSIKEKRDTAFGKIFAILFAILISVAGVYALADADIIPGGELLPMRFIGSSESTNDVKLQEVNSSNGAKNTENTAVQKPTNEVVDDEIVLEEYDADVDNWFLYDLDGATLRLPDGLEFMSGVRADYVTATFNIPVLNEGTRASVIEYDETLYEEVLPLVSIGYRTLDESDNGPVADMIANCRTSLAAVAGDDEVSTYATEEGIEVYYRFIRNTVDSQQYTYYLFCVEDESSQLYIEVNTDSDEDIMLASAMKKSLETLRLTD